MKTENIKKLSHKPWDKLSEKVFIGGFPVNRISRNDLVEIAMADCINSEFSEKRLVFDLNGHAISLARTNEQYNKDLQQADIIHADGGFIVTLSRIMKKGSIPERSATTDMLHDFSSAFSGSPFGFYLLGGEERVNKRCRDILESTYKGLKISGRRNGFFSIEEERSVVDEINNSGAEILWVGLGKPKEQEFCVRWKSELKPRWIISCGGCFNYVTGDYRRAPVWMQKLNLEWLHRMASEPKKLFWRYLITNPHALWISIKGLR